MRIVLGLITSMLVMFTAIGAWAQSYTLQPGDVLSVEVLEDPSLNRNTLVLPDGTIQFPFVGSVRASGRTVDQLQQALTQQLAPNFAAAPTVFASIAQLAPQPEVDDTVTFYALGEVGAPGPKAVEPGTTLLQALSQVGGFTQFAAQNRIQLRRVNPSSGVEAIFIFDLQSVGRGASISGSTTIMEGDVVLVPERGLFE